MRKTFSEIMLSLLIIGTLTLAFNVQSVKTSATTVFFDDFDGTELSTNWQLALKGATSGDVFANVADGYVETGLSGGADWWDSGGIATSHPISGDAFRIRINKAGQTMSCYSYFRGYVPCGFEFYLFNNPWAHWGYRAGDPWGEPWNPSTGWSLDNYGFGILDWGDSGRGLTIAKGMGGGNVVILCEIPSQYWAANGMWEILKEGSKFSVWYNEMLIGDVYDIPEIADKALYFVADARRYSGWETVFVKLDSVGVYVEEAAISATIDVDPDTLNLKNKGKSITCYIELPEGYNVSDTNVSTVKLNNTISASLNPTVIGDHDDDGIPDLMVKFNRREVISLIRSAFKKPTRFSQVTLTVTGKLKNGICFEGSDTIRIH